MAYSWNTPRLVPLQARVVMLTTGPHVMSGGEREKTETGGALPALSPARRARRPDREGWVDRGDARAPACTRGMARGGQTGSERASPAAAEGGARRS